MLSSAQQHPQPRWPRGIARWKCGCDKAASAHFRPGSDPQRVSRKENREKKKSLLIRVKLSPCRSHHFSFATSFLSGPCSGLYSQYLPQLQKSSPFLHALNTSAPPDYSLMPSALSLPHTSSITSWLRTARSSLPLCGQQRGWISPARMSRLSPLGKQWDLLLPISQPCPQPAVAANPRTRGLLASGPYIDPAGCTPSRVCGTGAGERDGIAGKWWGQDLAQLGLSDG